MFIQVIEAGVTDADAVRRQFERWRDELSGGAAGWLGTTGGITADGRFIAAVRFESGAGARANADRPEQDAWWSETAALLDDPTFAESEEYRSFGGGDWDQAGFVQLMRARITDRAQLESLEDQMEPAWAAHRPDLMGGYRVWLGDDEVLAVDYFTSEAEAREGESKPLPDDMAEQFSQWQELATDVRWFDLPEPWLESPT